MRKYFVFIIFFIIFANFGFPNSYTGSSDDAVFILRAPMWVFLESAPGSFDEEKIVEFVPPKPAIIEFSRYILSGMAYGWKFLYTPYDKKRQVKEFFELKPIHLIKKKDNSIKISDIDIKYPYCYCWAEYHISKSYKTHFDFWKKNYHKTIKGRGKGDRFDELDGVYNAYTEAVKNAIRTYGRKNIKNKPKEMNGEVLIKNTPRLYVESGYFKVEVELYLKLNEIIPYKFY